MSTTAEPPIAQHPVIRMFLNGIRAHQSQITALYLFGSRVRGDWRPDSDFDILVIVPVRAQALVDRLYDVVVDVQLETGLLISLKILTGEQYERLAAIPTPFLANVKAEGVRLGFDD